MSKESKKLIANNKKAYHEYFLEEKYEAGIALHGTEVKSLRMGKCSIKEAFVRIENDEVIIYQMHISPYEFGNRFNHEEDRDRRLLLHTNEILKFGSSIALISTDSNSPIEEIIIDNAINVRAITSTLD